MAPALFPTGGALVGWGSNTSSPWYELTPHTMAVHVLTTRFSLGQSHLPALLRTRLELFRTICLPSIVAQTSQHFRWVIVVDKRKVHEEISALVASMPNVAVYKATLKTSQEVYESPAAHQLELSGFWAEPVGDRERIYLSTRLDADDALPVGAFEEIRERARAALSSPAWDSERRITKSHFFCYLHATG